MDRYDRTTDLDEHMNVYIMHMSLYTSDTAVLCGVFLTSLKEGPLSWLTRLPPNSIDCFKTLVSKFGTQLVTSQPHHLTFFTLVNIFQEKGESLRLFMERFGKIALNIQNLSPYVVMHHMITSLRPGSFVDSLCMEPTANLDELRQNSIKFVQLEE